MLPDWDFVPLYASRAIGGYLGAVPIYGSKNAPILVQVTEQQQAPSLVRLIRVPEYNEGDVLRGKRGVAVEQYHHFNVVDEERGDERRKD
jgi:hypothetical protein